MTPLLNIVGSSVALLAFVVAFYALLARERKTPYITNYIFPPAALIFLAVLLVLIEQLLQGLRSRFTNLLAPVGISSQAPTTQLPRTDYWLILAAYGCFCLGALRILSNIWRLHNRQVNFRDDNPVRNLRVVRRWRNWWRRHSTTRSYEHSPADINDALVLDALVKCGLASEAEAAKGSIRTLAICGYSLREADDKIPVLAAELLKKDWLVQYTTCSRHPYEWVNKVKMLVGTDWAAEAVRISVVDAYMPHFGFTDSIHAQKTNEVESQDVVYVSSPESYAGVHTATAKAFNAQKSRAGGNFRRATLLVYEGCRALVDLESPEQFRLFLRHVLTSERMWGGMLTIFIEPEADESDVNLMRSHADYIRVKTGGESEGKDVAAEKSSNL